MKSENRVSNISATLNSLALMLLLSRSFHFPALHCVASPFLLHYLMDYVIPTGSLLITREEPEEVDERQTFPMSNNNSSEKKNESHDSSRQLILFCIGVSSAVVAIVAFMALKCARTVPASFEKLKIGEAVKAGRKLCAGGEFMSLGQFDCYNDDEESGGGSSS